MSFKLSLAAFVLSTLTTRISAHGRVSLITVGGNSYKGWDPETALTVNNTSQLPKIPSWSSANLGNIYVSPDDFNTSQITCHFNATPGQSYVDISAGTTIDLQWNEWPTSHKGPVMTYLAPCNGSCTTVDKRKLAFVKVDELGWLNSSDPDYAGLGGTWASDVLIANNFTWTTQLPPELEEGNYVLRHEIIALHVANETDGAQAYPQCINLRVSKVNATDVPQEVPGNGTVGPRMYKATDPGILVDIHHNITGYPIPGPKLWDEAVPRNDTDAPKARHPMVSLLLGRM